MKTLKSFKKILSLLAVVALALLVAYYFVYQDIKNKNENISSLEQDLDFQSNRQEYLLSTQRMIENISPDIERINNSIISAGGDVEFIESLESIARNNGLSITIDSLTIEDDPAFSSNGITTLRIKAETSGAWKGTYAFLAQIESLSYKIKINRFSFLNNADAATPEAGTGSLTWQSTLEIRVLKYK